MSRTQPLLLAVTALALALSGCAAWRMALSAELARLLPLT